MRRKKLNARAKYFGTLRSQSLLAANVIEMRPFPFGLRDGVDSGLWSDPDVILILASKTQPPCV
jgi:hypothetical protein